MTHPAWAFERRSDRATPSAPSRARGDGRGHVAGSFLRDVLVGLSAKPKRLSPKYLYDREGAALFEVICELPEYYVTRTELSILAARAGDIAARICSARARSRSARAPAAPCRVVEPGAGSGTKTRLLLQALGPLRCVEYVPIDIAVEQLARAAARLAGELPWLRVTPFNADFTARLHVPSADTAARTVVYFPGSTIGNFDPPAARRLLARFARAAGPAGLVLLGVDLKKDPAMLHAAYNDAHGVTAQFNKNLLRRINAELRADFDVDAFHHYAFYAPASARIEMHLVSARRQRVVLAGRAFRFLEGESLCTERSYKYDLSTAERLGRAAGLSLLDGWFDDERRFAVLLFEPARPP